MNNKWNSFKVNNKQLPLTVITILPAKFSVDWWAIRTEVTEVGHFFPRSHSKSTFGRNFQFFTPPPSFPPCSSLFVLHVPPPSTYVRFRELPPSQKKFLDAYKFSNEKLGSKNREKNYFFCKLSIKEQCL